MNCMGDGCMTIFLATFKKVSYLVVDESPNIRQAMTFLNHTMKCILNDAVFDHLEFDVKEFMNILADCFQKSGSVGKEFLIDWIMAIEEITTFEITFYLPLFFKDVFELLLV